MTVPARLDSFVMLSRMNTDSWPATEGTISAAVPEQNTPAAVTVSLRDDPDAGRYEVRADGELVGFAQYRLRNGRIVFFHTEITSTAASAASSPGLRSRTQGRAGWRWCRCAFIAGFIRRHPDEYLLLVLPGMREQVMRDAGRD